MYKLYSEVNTGSRGQKPCAPNVAIHVGLQRWETHVLWPYGVQGNFFFYSAIRCIWSVYNLWPYGVQGIFIFIIPPYGVNGRFMFFGPMVYRAGYF